MLPLRNVNKPALVIELKFNHSADTAIDQIKQKHYPSKIAEYTGDILLVGISYDKESNAYGAKVQTGYNCYNVYFYGCLLFSLVPYRMDVPEPVSELSLLPS